MTEKKVNTKLPVIFQNIKQYEKDDARFLKVKIWLMHTGVNFNGSSFNKEVVEKAIPTLANTPILAFLEENSAGEQDFSDHRIVLHRNEEGEFNLKYLGSAVGVIPETNNARWEMRVTDSGEEKEYLVVDALMWNKWDEPTNIMKQKGVTSQSMELSDAYSGTFDKDGVFQFESFEFFGACLLGDDVLPAMQNSTVEIEFSKNEALQKTIEKKMQEFYTLFSSQEGGTEMEDMIETEVVAEFEDVNVEIETVNIEVTETIEETETTQSFEENVESIDTNSEEDVVEVIETSTEAEFAITAQEFESLTNELNELRTYKRQREESDIKAKFADKLSEEEFASVFEAMKDADIQDVEDKLFALYGKKNFSMTSIASITSIEEVNKVNLPLSKKEDSTPTPYGGLFEKYNK